MMMPGSTIQNWEKLQSEAGARSTYGEMKKEVLFSNILTN
jgi:hypothetical protein